MPPAAVDPGPEAWALRALIYRRLAESGSCPPVSELAAELDRSVTETGELLRVLARAFVIALDGEGEVWMAHPFSAVPTAFPVSAGGRRYYANCAWDAIALPMLLGVDGGGSYPCPASGQSIPLRVRAGKLQPVDAVVRFPVPARDFWKDIGFT